MGLVTVTSQSCSLQRLFFDFLQVFHCPSFISINLVTGYVNRIHLSLLESRSMAADLCLSCIMYFNRTNWFLWLNGRRLTVPIGGTLWRLNFKQGSFLPPPLYKVKANNNSKLDFFHSLFGLQEESGQFISAHPLLRLTWAEVRVQISGPGKWSRNKRGRGWGIRKDGSSTGECVKAVEVGLRE